jgi:Family of unknown function (DUF6084)
MIDLSFAVTGAEPEPHAAMPTLKFRLQIREAAARPIHAVLLRCQLRIEPRRRRYASTEKERMTDLFGEPERWKDTLQPLVWTQTSLTVPAFAGHADVSLPAACTYDLEVAAAKYLYAIEDGVVPLLFLFSGTVFAKTENGFQVEQIPWDREAAFQMPVRTWRDLMESYFPGHAWIRVRHESLAGLRRFRARHALLSWDDTIAALVSAAEELAR